MLYISRVPEAASRKRRAPILLIGLAVLIVLLIVPWLLRSTIATSVARSELESSGFTCDDRFEVHLSALLSDATVAPTRCEHEGGLIASLETSEPAQVEMSGLAPSLVTISQVTLTLRDQNLRGGDGWGNDTIRSIEQRVAGLVKGLSELSEVDWPETHVAQVRVLRDATPAADLRGMRLQTTESLNVQIAGVSFPNTRTIVLDNVHGTATPAQVTLDGDAEVQSQISIVSFTTDARFGITATGLDGPSPQLRLRTGP